MKPDPESKETRMQERPRRSATLIVIIVFSGLVFAAANLAVLVWSVRGAVEVPLLVEFSRVCMPCVAYFVAAPLLVAVLVAIMVYRLVATSNRAMAKPVAAAPTRTESTTGALRLLGLLQQEGRFVDFIQEDIEAYDDAQVGAAVRAIHAGCRKALDERLALARIFDAEEGTEVTVEPGFDPSAVRLSGNVTGDPPFRGILQHGGWRTAQVSLPETQSGADPTVIAPAEVEIP
jgi:hypothetical protein